jgi:HEAT repeat protein
MDRSRLVALVDDPAPFLEDPDPAIRRLAASSCAIRTGDAAIVAALEHVLASDPEPRVRAEAAEVLALAGPQVQESLLEHRSTTNPAVAEAVATGLGEVESRVAVPWLIDAAAGNDDRLVREAAVAALGAIGDPRATRVLLDLAASGPPQVRRRAVVALTAFEGEAVQAAIEAAAADRNPMVREVAEMLVGRPIEGSQDRQPDRHH